MLLKWHCYSFYGWVILPCLYTPHIHPFLCWWMFRLLPCAGCCEWCCSEHWRHVSPLNHGFLWSSRAGWLRTPARASPALPVKTTRSAGGCSALGITSLATQRRPRAKPQPSWTASGWVREPAQAARSQALQTTAFTARGAGPLLGVSVVPFPRHSGQGSHRLQRHVTWRVPHLPQTIRWCAGEKHWNF